MKILFSKMDPAATIPRRMTPGAAGLDLFAVLGTVVEPGRWTTVHTGIRVAIPEGYEGQVRPRSGLARRWGITVLNSPGTIDADYRGELLVLLINHGSMPFDVEPGDRIAQLVIAPVAMPEPEEVDDLPLTERGADGFGSTG